MYCIQIKDLLLCSMTWCHMLAECHTQWDVFIGDRFSFWNLWRGGDFQRKVTPHVTKKHFNTSIHVVDFTKDADKNITACLYNPSFKKSFLMLIVSLSSILTFNEHKRPRENKMFAFYILFQILLSMQCDANSNNSHNIFHDPPNISDYQILLL